MTDAPKTIAEMPALKPCPFCGGDVEVMRRNNSAFVRCRECRAESYESGTANVIAAWNRRALPADDAEMEERVRKAVSPQISEGLGAVLRKFCDSDHAAKARFHLHAMPDSDWKTLIDMLSSEAARAALSAMRGEP